MSLVGKRILITGAKGFIGHYLCNELSSEGIEFLALDIKDLIDNDSFVGISPGANDILIHLANRNSVPKSWENPVSFIESNAIGTLKVAEYCRKNKVSLIYLSSYLYGNPDYFPVDEKHRVQTLSPYAFSKRNAEEIIRFYGEQYNLNYTILRPFNIYGKGQKDEFIIPFIFAGFRNHQQNSVEIKDLKPKRDFMHVRDLVRAIIMCAANISKQTYNVCSGNSISIQELAEKIKELLNSDKAIVDLNESRKNEIMDCYGTYEKIRTEIGWSPEIDLRTGLKDYI